MEMKEPTIYKEVFRPFKLFSSTITEPFTRLLRKDKAFVWSNEQKESFIKIQNVLVTRPMLAIFNKKLKTKLHTDASSLGFGAILLQFVDNSKETSPEQRRYRSYELETLAVVLGLQNFRVYLLGISFLIVTDCSELRIAFTKKDLVWRVVRWWLQVQEYNFDIIHRPVVDIIEADWIVTAQDDQLNMVRKILKQRVIDKNTKQYFENYELLDNKLYKKQEGSKSLWVGPKAFGWQICKLCHDDNGHFGLEKDIKENTEKLLHASGRKEGDIVMILKTDAPCTGMSRRLLPKFKGPFKITKALFNDSLKFKI
nr:unnamed protein product [Callosobruchus analis]